ncbi:MAG: MarR family transcriptional regulator [Clostridiales bacterium]|nr:MarR family transcriptional regulator [Clostridiales bacterium]
MSHAQEQALLAALNEHQKTRRHVPDFYGVPLGEFHMLKLIETMMEENGNSETGIQASLLSVRSHISRSAVSQLLKSLEKKELIERVVGTCDRRVVYVRLTANGQNITASVQKFMYHFLGKIIAELGDTNTDTLISLLRQMNQIMQSLDLESIMKEIDPNAL